MFIDSRLNLRFLSNSIVLSSQLSEVVLGQIQNRALLSNLTEYPENNSNLADRNVMIFDAVELSIFIGGVVTIIVVIAGMIICCKERRRRKVYPLPFQREAVESQRSPPPQPRDIIQQMQQLDPSANVSSGSSLFRSGSIQLDSSLSSMGVTPVETDGEDSNGSGEAIDLVDLLLGERWKLLKIRLLGRR